MFGLLRALLAKIGLAVNTRKFKKSLKRLDNIDDAICWRLKFIHYPDGTEFKIDAWEAELIALQAYCREFGMGLPEVRVMLYHLHAALLVKPERRKDMVDLLVKHGYAVQCFERATQIDIRDHDAVNYEFTYTSEGDLVAPFIIPDFMSAVKEAVEEIEHYREMSKIVSNS